MGEPDLETMITLVESPLGGPPHVRERERAAAWLIANADRAHPAILERARQGRAGPGSIEVLGRLGRSDSVPVLAGLLGGDERSGRAAASALARHPDPAALAALRDGLRADGDQAVRSADALAARGDDTACPELRAAIAGDDARVRYHALQAALELHCVPDDMLARLAASDPAPEVRELARRAAGT
jgi:hypothetical protein